MNAVQLLRTQNCHLRMTFPHSLLFLFVLLSWMPRIQIEGEWEAGSLGRETEEICMPPFPLLPFSWNEAWTVEGEMM